MHARGFKKIIIFYRDILERKVDFCTFSRVNTSYQWFFFFTSIRENKIYFFVQLFLHRAENFNVEIEKCEFFFTKSPRNNFTNSSCFALGNPNFTPFESLMIIGVRKKKFKAKKYFKRSKVSFEYTHLFLPHVLETIKFMAI